MKYDLILFDADGTLFDFDRAENDAFEKTMKRFGVSENLKFLHKEYEKIKHYDEKILKLRRRSDD